MKKHLLLTALFFVFQLSYSQNIKFEHLTLENGLPVSWVKSVCKDKMGFVWIGTSNGFCRYDGYTIKSYFNIADDSTSLASNQVNMVKELADGRLIIATFAGGISIFDPKTEKFRTFLNKKSDIGKFENVYDIQVDRDNKVWLACEQGIVLFNSATFKFTQMLPFPKSVKKGNSFRSLLLSKDGTLWASSQYAGVVGIDTKTGKILYRISLSQLKSSLKDDDKLQCTTYITLDNEGALWIATEGLGLWRYKNKALTNVLALEVNNKSDYSKYFNKGICFDISC